MKTVFFLMHKEEVERMNVESLVCWNVCLSIDDDCVDCEIAY